MQAQVFIIYSHLKDHPDQVEIDSAYVNRQAMEVAKSNQRKNHPDYNFYHKVLNLNGVGISNNDFCFNIEKNK